MQSPQTHRVIVLRGVGPAARRRRGSITVLSAILLTSLVIFAGVCINLTQMSTAKTEIRLASDAAAKAGAVVLGQSQNVTTARAAAMDIAARHAVANKSMQISEIDVRFGYSEKSEAGGFVFTENQQPLNAVRVDCRLGDGATTGKAKFFMGGVVDTQDFSLDYTATATRVDHDLCLVVDRSGSMAWDMSNAEWEYPLNQGETNSSIIQKYFQPPHPTLSRWAALTRSTAIFFDHLSTLESEVRVGLVTYSSNFKFGLYESHASTIERGLTTNFDSMIGDLNRIGTKELIGNTNIASGMQSAVQVLTATNARLTAKGTMVLLTDGNWNQGTDPAVVAQAAALANITVHTITFSDQADQTKMIEVAGIGGGNHYHAPDEESLRAIFAQIAETLPTVLTK